MATTNTLYDETIKYGYAKLLQSQTPSNVAAVIFNNMDTTYDAYSYELVNVANSVADTNLNAHVTGVANPNVPLTGSTYYWSRLLIDLNSTATGGPSCGLATGGVLVQSFRIGTNTVLGTGVSGEFLINRGQQSTLCQMWSHVMMYTSANAASMAICAGSYWAGTDVRGVQFSFSSGNMSGRINQYGLKRGGI